MLIASRCGDGAVVTAELPGMIARQEAKGREEEIRSMPIQSVEFWEEKAWLAEEAAKTMRTPAAKAAMLEIAQLYRKLAEQTRNLKGLTA